ncbi:metalloprotease TldD [Thioalkalivibrio sulfidiphilus]|uniref:TldD protein n=1 Tax=Thioalkalivibrio sulfidiphilus (strain HL-EbGR7) TaxID=396588 RepID=B8GUM7_THISH|nr:metalloprotease TldD [Thioalkalivibrio sulfidiphilus]ACL73347.1 TldD protein [Thioalkalivibrio sulfidiphilus HL-EbGr7]
MTQVLQIAKQQFMEPAGLTEGDLDRVLGGLMGPGIDGGDLYFQLTRHESWSLEDGIVKDGSYNIEQGVGVRALSGDKTGFAYSDDIRMPTLLEASSAARAIARAASSGTAAMRRDQAGHSLYAPLDPLATLDEQAKIDLLHRVDAEARRQDPRVSQVMVSLNGVHEVIMVANTDGTLAADVRPLVRLNVNVIVEGKDGRREQASSGGGGRSGYEFFLDEERALGYAREAVRQALVNLEAVDAPAGTLTVVLGPGWPGVLLHEAVGHGLEGDFNRKGTSAFSGRIGQQVASPGVTVVDDGTLAGRRGSLNVDDEGIPTQCTTLIENGVLRGFMQDRLNARLMGVPTTGNGRRESYAHLPMPRMTNTYMLAGEHDPGEILASVKNGLYAVNFGGGQVDITSGKFVFSASEAYLIENGRVTRPVKGATLIGNGPEVLTRVSMVGNDLKLDAGVGTCGKDGQSVPVGVGQPTLKVDGLTVGGTST